MSQEHGHEHPHPHPAGHFFPAIPVFLVDDVAMTADYYRDMLGFSVDFLWGEPPSYASVSRGETVLHFSKAEPPGRRNSVSAAGAGNGTDVYLIVAGIEDVFREMKRHGVRILKEPQTYPYGMREFNLEDVNGYRIIIGEVVET
jgi:catechol 2,3-dioxygenase-like lactoylglutathione lyase family enzyme